MKNLISPSEDRGGEILKGVKGGVGPCHLKQSNIHTKVDNDIVSMFEEEGLGSGKSTMVHIRQAIVKELLLISESREGGDLESQRGGQRGGNVKLTPLRGIVREWRLHGKNCRT